MRDIWTANIVAKMHLYEIQNSDLAKKLGWTKAYIGQVLNGVRKPRGAQVKIEEAVDELISDKLKGQDNGRDQRR